MVLTEKELRKLAEFTSGKFREIGKLLMERDGHLTQIEPETPAWEAWKAWFQRNEIPYAYMQRLENSWRNMRVFNLSKPRFTVVTEYPPADDGSALLEELQSSVGRKSSKTLKKLHQELGDE